MLRSHVWINPAVCSKLELRKKWIFFLRIGFSTDLFSLSGNECTSKPLEAGPPAGSGSVVSLRYLPSLLHSFRTDVRRDNHTSLPLMDLPNRFPISPNIHSLWSQQKQKSGLVFLVTISVYLCRNHYGIVVQPHFLSFLFFFCTVQCLITILDIKRKQLLMRQMKQQYQFW